MHGKFKSALADCELASRHLVTGRFCEVLRERVVYGPVRLEDLARESGVKARTIRSYMDAENPVEPPLSNALAILCVLGRPCFSRVLNLYGYDAVAHEEPDELEIIEIIPIATASLAEAAVILKDRRIDPHERVPWRRVCNSLVGTFLRGSDAGAAI
jgi:hypothetical protein